MFNHAIILAAGRGIRLMPLSKKIPKAMVKVKNETLILSGIKKVQKYIKNIYTIHTHPINKLFNVFLALVIYLSIIFFE